MTQIALNSLLQSKMKILYEVNIFHIKLEIIVIEEVQQGIFKNFTDLSLDLLFHSSAGFCTAVTSVFLFSPG